jgi:hypothetical protein
MRSFIIIILTISLSWGNSQDSINKTLHIDSLRDTFAIPKINLITKSPIKAAAISALIPGGGQIYTGNYVKSGAFLASEIIIGLVGYSRYWDRTNLQKNSSIMLDSLMHFPNVILNTRKDTVKNASDTTVSVLIDTLFGSTQYRMSYDYNRFLEKSNNFFVYQCIAWMSGLYYWNILDAIKNTRYFMNDDNKNPSTAFWLSTIPGLGLGQLYNGELSKAGMVFMVQMNLAFMIYNNNKLMHICEDNLNKIKNPASKENWAPIAAQLKGDWDSRREDAFRNRNRWAWYSIAFYFYSIFDAIVDAHLHDAKKKMKLEPDLLAGEKGVGLHCTMTF